MHGDNFWKGVITFGLTFWLGFLAAENFGQKAPPKETKDTSAKLPVGQKNCVPADPQLKYHLLKNEKDAPVAAPVEKKATVTEKRADEKADLKKLRQNKSDVLYIPERDAAEPQILLHKEKCFEKKEAK